MGEPRTHDGFFGRFSLGGGLMNSSFEDEVGTVKIDGGAVELTASIGYAVVPNLILYIGVAGPGMIDPHYEVADTSRRSSTFRGSAQTTGGSAGLSYYLMPANVFVTGAIGWGTFELLPDEDTLGYESHTGVLWILELGKEWWLEDYLGMGFVGGATWHSMPDASGDRWSGVGYTLRFCFTVN